ncbi:hypothetical protein Tco_0755103 [Tanacetum coccineum]
MGMRLRNGDGDGKYDPRNSPTHCHPYLAQNCPKGKRRKHPKNRQDRSAGGMTNSIGEATELIGREMKVGARLIAGTYCLGTTVEPVATKADAAPTQEIKSRQLEMALESGNLNHLIKDVRQRGRGNAKGRDAGKDKVINMISSWSDDRKRKSVVKDESWMKAPIVFPSMSMEDASDKPLIIEAVMEGYLVRRVRGPGSIGGGDVQTLFRELESRYKVAFKEHPNRFSGFRRRRGETIRENRNGFKIPPSGILDNTLHGKVPHPKGNRDSGHSVDHHFRVSEVRKEANGRAGGQSEYQPREGSPRKSGFDRTDVGQPCIPGSAGNDRGKPVGRIFLRAKKKGSGIRQNPGGNQRSGRMDERMNSPSGEIPNMDIKPGAREEKRRKLEDMRIRDTIRCKWLRTTKRKLRSTRTKARNAGATYQRLVDAAFQSQIGRNLEAYVDDMVIKSNDEKVLITDIARHSTTSEGST